MNGFQYAVAAWLPIVIFPQTMAPTFRYGFPGTFGLVIAALIAIVVIQVLHLRSARRGESGETSFDEEGDEEAGAGVSCDADSKVAGKHSKAREIDALF